MGPPGPPWVLGPWVPGATRKSFILLARFARPAEGKHDRATSRGFHARHGQSKGCGLAVFGEAGLGLNPPAHLRWCDGRVRRLKSFKLPFFNMRLALPWVRASRRAERAGPSWGPLSLYPLADSGRFDAISALVALPFGR